MDRDRTSEEFFVEAGRLVEALARELLVLEADVRAGVAAPGAFDAMSGHGRTLESLARTFGADVVAGLAHGVGELLDALGRGAVASRESALDLLLEGVDDLHRLVEADSAGDAPDVHPARYRAAVADALAGGSASRVVVAPAAGRGVGESDARIDMHKLDALLGLVGELGAVEGALDRLSERLRTRSADTALAREAQHVRRRLRRGVHALREGVLDARIVRLDRVFSPATLVVRELAVEQGKRVRLVTRGGDVELDRAIADGLYDVLTELVRNAVDHGVESPTEREASGKNPTATITLGAEVGGGRVRLRVEDDGRGVASERLRVLGVAPEPLLGGAAGDGRPGDPATLVAASDRATGSRVARGGGLEAVRDLVARLGGGVELASEPGVGTCVTLSVPLTLLRVPALLFEVRGMLFAISRDVVSSVRAASDSDVERRSGSELIEERGERLPLCRVADLFSLGAGGEASTENGKQLLFIDVAARRAALLVDRIHGHEPLLVKPFGPSLGAVPSLVGAAERGADRLALVIDPASLIEEIAVSAAQLGRTTP